MRNKRCSRCGTEKEAAQFYTDPRGKYGLHAWCKTCAAEYQRERRQARRLASPPPAGFLTGEFLPNVVNIPIRPDRTVMVAHIPADLTKAEASRIERIVMAFADPSSRGESP
jgi:hypothetical protein